MNQTGCTAHILAVDDDPAIRQLIADYLSQNDLRVSTAADGKEMARVLEHSVVDLIILDLKLPGEDGMTLAQAAREIEHSYHHPTGRPDQADR